MCESHVPAERTLDEDIVAFMRECLAKEFPDSYLIAVLHRVQNRYGYLSRKHLEEVSHFLGVPTSTVSGVATFYHYFRLKPAGKYSISVCMGTACFVKGADKILQAIKTELGIDMGETSSDGLFSLDESRCLGVCAMAPVVTVNHEIHGNVTPRKVPELLNRLREEDI